MHQVDRPTRINRKLFGLVRWVFRTCLLLLLLKASVLSAAKPEEVTFPSGNPVLHGSLYKPLGNGPFPTFLYNHRSERKPGWKPELGGGIQTELTVKADAEQKLGLPAAIDFADRAMSWNSSSLRGRMVTAIRKADIFLRFVQAEND